MLPLQYPQYPQYTILITLPLPLLNCIQISYFSIVSTFILVFYSFNYTVKSRGVCNRLPTLYRDIGSSPGRLQDGVNATLYIDRRSILLADHCSHFSYLLPYYTLLPPPSSCIYRGFRATFTIKSFMHSHTLQNLTLTL